MTVYFFKQNIKGIGDPDNFYFVKAGSVKEASYLIVNSDDGPDNRSELTYVSTLDEISKKAEDMEVHKVTTMA